MAEQYFHATPSSRSRHRTVAVRARGVDAELRTDRGIFSPERVDTGTMVLLAGAPEPPESGTFLDLGCGYGPVAVVLAALRPDAVVWAVDVNERARELCERNARAAGLDNVRVGAPEDVPADVRFDLIWSNPPIRVGKDALHDILADWIGRLSPEGEAVLVIARNLGADTHARWLAEQVGTVERLGSKKGYRLLRVTPPSADA